MTEIFNDGGKRLANSVRRYLRPYVNLCRNNADHRYYRAAKFLQLVHSQYFELAKSCATRELSPEGSKMS